MITFRGTLLSIARKRGHVGVVESLLEQLSLPSMSIIKKMVSLEVGYLSGSKCGNDR